MYNISGGIVIKRIFNHRFFNRFAVLGILFLIIWGMFMYNVVGASIGYLFKLADLDWMMYLTFKD